MSYELNTDNEDVRYKILLSSIDELKKDFNKYVELQEIEVIDFSMHAFEIKCGLGWRWIPNSVMKKKDNKVFIPKWFLNVKGKL